MSSSIPQLKDGEQTVYFQAGGEWCFLKTPASYRAEGEGTPCVIQCHGHHGYVKNGEADWLTEDFKLEFVNSLIDSGIAVASSHATGNHWGRPSAVAANGALFDSLVEGSNVDASRMGLWGGGLGGALLWNSVTGPLLGRLKAICLQQATISYESVIRHGKFKSFLLEAYGLPADTPDDLAVAALSFNDPVTRTRLLIGEKGRALASELPEVLFIHGDVDENMLYQENPVRLSGVLGPLGAKYSFQTYEGVGHATYQLGEVAAAALNAYFRRVFNL